MTIYTWFLKSITKALEKVLASFSPKCGLIYLAVTHALLYELFYFGMWKASVYIISVLLDESVYREEFNYMEKLLTITVPCFNVEDYLEDALASYIVPEVFPYVEILIVNDGSTDRTLEIAESFCKKYSDCFKVISKENGGHGSAINTGIEYASGKYFRVIDGDDWVDPQSFHNYINKLKELDADLVLSTYSTVRDDGLLLKHYTFPPEIENRKEFIIKDNMELIRPYYKMHTVAFKTKILKDIPRISEHCFYVDTEFVTFPLKYVHTCAFINECVYQYRVGRAGQSINLSSLHKNRAQHLRVCNRIIDFSNECRGEELHGLIVSIMREMIHSQNEIYLTMRVEKETFRELSSFICDIKRRVPLALKISKYWQDRVLQVDNYYVYLLAAIVTHIRMKHYEKMGRGK